ncbi:hypothetical protein PVK06_012957 [Gossypium arboreum]|uniref:Uncharacterized protein n=1 Tax=Gossypium arboreum TaxID=29729 RepID=A0ABR0QCX2_GOSAR|nr:hypothetical protein PVK06_012957 [Gossypium arboreum]
MILLDKYRRDYSGAHCQMILRAWCEMFIRILKVFGPSAPTGGGAFETTVLGPPAGTKEAFEATVTEALANLYAVGADCTYIRGNKAKPMKQKCLI